MSDTLGYEPIKPRKYKTLDDKLKFILIEKFDLRNGTQKLNNSHIPYLEGLVDAGIVDAQKLIDCINKYAEINIFLEY